MERGDKEEASVIMELMKTLKNDKSKFKEYNFWQQKKLDECAEKLKKNTPGNSR